MPDRTEKRAAFDMLKALHDNHGRDLIARAYSILGDHHAAQDIVQETFIKLYTGDSPIPERQDHGGWLKRLVINAAIDSARKRATRSRVESQGGDMPEIPMPELTDGPHISAVRSTLEGLSRRDREILELRVIDDLSFRDIAAQLGCSENAAQIRYRRIQSRMRTLLTDREPREREETEPQTGFDDGSARA